MSKSSTDSGNGSGNGAAFITIGVAGKGATGAGEGAAEPFNFGGSIADDAMSSNLEVAASSLWMRDVSATFGITGVISPSMIVRYVELFNSFDPDSIRQINGDEKLKIELTVPFDEGG